MAEEEATQAPQEEEAPNNDVKPDIKPEVQHLTLTVVHQVSLEISPVAFNNLHPSPRISATTPWYI